MVAAVLGTIITLYMNRSLTGSVEPIRLIQKTYALNEIIERITADYHNLEDSEGDHDLTTLRTRIQSGDYGEYSQQTGFITFPLTGGTESPDSSGQNRMLKAVITSDNHSITLLFTE